MGNLMTCEQWAGGPSDVMFVHGLDLMRHVLQGSKAPTAYGNSSEEQRERAAEYLEELTAAMEQYKQDFRFDQAVEEIYTARPLVETEYLDETGEDFDVEAYIDEIEEERPHCFVQYHSEPDKEKALHILFDVAVPWCDRDKDYMLERHEKAYQMALQAERDGRPCRVTAFCREKYDDAGTVIQGVILKDYDDPIFPAIWGTYQSNLTANCMLNLIAVFLVGTHTKGNGFSQNINASDCIDVMQEDGVVIGKTNFLTDDLNGAR